MSLHEPLLCVVLNDNRDNRDNILFKLCATNFSRLLEKFITQKKLSLLSFKEGEHKQTVQIFNMFALFLLWQATKSSAATLSRDDNQLKMSLLCTCESSDKKNTENQYGIKENRKSVFALSHKKKLTPSRTISVLNGVSLFYLFTFLPFYL